MNSSSTTLQKDRVDTTSEGESNRCPDCESEKTTVPVVTVNETTLWRCVRAGCSKTWTAPATGRDALADTPAPTRVLDRLVGAARHHEDSDYLRVAEAVSTLYRDAGIEVPDIDWAAYEEQFGRERSAELVADD